MQGDVPDMNGLHILTIRHHWIKHNSIITVYQQFWFLDAANEGNIMALQLPPIQDHRPFFFDFALIVLSCKLHHYDSFVGNHTLGWFHYKLPTIILYVIKHLPVIATLTHY